jgi:hypothetical protein
LSAKAEEAIFIGYEKGTKGYKFWSPKRRHVIVSSTVHMLPMRQVGLDCGGT